MSRFCVETSMHMLEIPYGDCFEVHMRWDAEAHSTGGKGEGGGGAGECLLNIRAGVKFTKSCLFRSKIETDTLKELAKTYQEWAALAQKVATGQVAAF